MHFTDLARRLFRSAARPRPARHRKSTTRLSVTVLEDSDTGRIRTDSDERYSRYGWKTDCSCTGERRNYCQPDRCIMGCWRTCAGRLRQLRHVWRGWSAEVNGDISWSGGAYQPTINNSIAESCAVWYSTGTITITGNREITPFRYDAAETPESRRPSLDRLARTTRYMGYSSTNGCVLHSRCWRKSYRILPH